MYTKGRDLSFDVVNGKTLLVTFWLKTPSKGRSTHE